MTGEEHNLSNFGENVNLIEIKIKKIGQLFNSLDPSPFLEKDLDADAFEYIVGSVSEHSLKTKHKIVIFLPKNVHKKVSEIEIKRAIHNYFEYKMIMAERGIKLKIKEGQFSFIVGITFLVVCTLLSEYIHENVNTLLAGVVAEGLLIGGWVAMWKPISDLLYEWWPISKEKKVYKKISEIDIEFRYD